MNLTGNYTWWYGIESQVRGLSASGLVAPARSLQGVADHSFTHLFQSPTHDNINSATPKSPALHLVSVKGISSPGKQEARLAHPLL